MSSEAVLSSNDRNHAPWGVLLGLGTFVTCLTAGIYLGSSDNANELQALKHRVPFKNSIVQMANVLCPITNVEDVIDAVKSENGFSDLDLGKLLDTQLIRFPDCPQPPSTSVNLQS